MTMTLQTLSDRIEINDLLISYCTAVDSGNIDRFDEIFTPDAIIDYSVFGFDRAGLQATKQFLKQSLPAVPNKQHMISNSEVFLDGDRATARTLCFNPMAVPLESGGYQMTYYHLWYVDRLVRTDKGWRISERVEEKSHIFTAEGVIS